MRRDAERMENLQWQTVAESKTTDTEEASMSENEKMTQEEIQSRLIRINASTNALEALLCAVIEHLPSRKRELVLASFQKPGKAVGDFVLFDDYSDEELEASKEANQKLLRLLSIGKRAPKARP
jgi:hypothetical protein